LSENICEVASVDIYLDIIIMENLVMNYIILLVTSKFAKAPTSSLRLFLGALAGSAYVVIMILMPELTAYYTAFGKIILSFLIVAVSFRIEKPGSFFKILLFFYITTFIFAGASFAFIYFDNQAGFIRNGIMFVFWESKWSTVLLAVLTCAIIVRVFIEVVQSRFSREKLLRNVSISFDNRIATVQALVDTGNSLHDPLSNLPVIVVEFNAIKNILPEDIQKIFSESKGDDLSLVSDIVLKSGWYSRFRLIPFTSLGKENGMLIGFKPDYIEVDDTGEKKGIKDVIVGIYEKALSKDSQYCALLSPDLI